LQTADAGFIRSEVIRGTLPVPCPRTGRALLLMDTY